MKAPPARRLPRIACLAGLLALGATSAPPSRVPIQEHVRVVDRPWQRVGLSVTISDRKGRPLADLSRDEVRVMENGVPVALEDFGLEGGRRDRPLSVAVLLDLSGSMGRQVRRVREAARALLSQLRPGDEVMVAKFNDQLTVLQPFTGRPEDLGRSLESIGRAWGGTAIFQAVGRTLHDVRDRAGRKIILIVSDGLDNDIDREQPVLQSLFLQDLLRSCLRTETTVYGVRPGLGSTSWLPFEGFVDQTGGRLLYTGGDLPGLFARLGEEFLSQYYLAFDIDPKAGEGRWRRLKVEVTRPGAVVRAMRGYFTPRGHLETLLRELDDQDDDVRADAAYDLGFTGEPEAGEGLSTALADKAPEVRRQAIASLARLGEASALPGLVDRLGDAEAAVRGAAEEAIESFGSQAIPGLSEAILTGVGRRRPTRRVILAAGLLGRLGDERGIDPLSRLLQDAPPETRAAAARALGDLGQGLGIPPLRSALEDEDPGVRVAALRSIAGFGGALARPILQDLLARETDPGVRAAAAAALGALE
jgi:VWFA-related protein